MILTLASNWPTPYSSARKDRFSTQFPALPSQQRRIYSGSRRRCWPPPLEYSRRRRIRALSDDSGEINRSREQEVVLRRNSGEQLDSNRPRPRPSGEFYKLLEALYVSSRPHTMIGTAISVASISLLPLTSLADLYPALFVGTSQAIILFLFMQLYVTGLNQLYDVEIDKVNKPYLPLASGVFSMEFGITLVTIYLIGCVAMGIIFHAPPLLFGVLICCILGSAYSIELPFLRWKRNPFLAPMCIIIVRAIAIPFATFLHIQKYVVGRPILFTRPLIFTSCFSFLFFIVVSLFKDITDIEGDRKFGLNSLFFVRFGQNRVFWICISILMSTYGGAMGIGAFSSFLVSKFVIVRLSILKLFGPVWFYFQSHFQF